MCQQFVEGHSRVGLGGVNQHDDSTAQHPLSDVEGRLRPETLADKEGPTEALHFDPSHARRPTHALVRIQSPDR